MSEPGIPKTAQEAIAYIIWFVVILGFGLEFVVALLHEEWTRAIVAFVA